MDLRILLGLTLLVGGGVVALAGAAPQASLTPSEALSHEGEASVKGMVVSVDEAARTFVLTDGASELTVRASRALPATVVPEAGVVVEGTLVLEAGVVVLEAHEVQVGCPSKYEA